ncbi:hypothetical protein SAPIO_CDS9467 [Scedosporium apiospermum]|uniref:Uncharacterized protein n=1 Tax=Pseudallescheria apiosperma TaxID=563466 RepID=A0A084FWV3_PSEDA|nr:uncharacterized protein SAPIO_CDS9467 [Scedosporium apiospermum]KEZ39565.1 hypothetical protein SAPIO_CDS9467 [Scedosporium apiospermum]
MFAEMERERVIPLVRDSISILHRQRVANVLAHEQTADVETRTGHVGGTRRRHLIMKALTQSLKKFSSKGRGKQSLPSPYAGPSSKPVSPPFDEPMESPASLTSDAPADEDEHWFNLWDKTNFLKIGLEDWKTQMLKMIAHVDELQDTKFGLDTSATSPELDAKLGALQETGSRIKERLGELVDEYDEYIRKCSYIIDGMKLATQLELSEIERNDAKTNLDISRVNLRVASMTCRDSRLMRSMAFLGVVFLPTTLITVCTTLDKD